jgi:hypothetical protein
MIFCCFWISDSVVILSITKYIFVKISLVYIKYRSCPLVLWLRSNNLIPPTTATPTIDRIIERTKQIILILLIFTYDFKFASWSLRLPAISITIAIFITINVIIAYSITLDQVGDYVGGLEWVWAGLFLDLDCEVG